MKSRRSWAWGVQVLATIMAALGSLWLVLDCVPTIQDAGTIWVLAAAFIPFGLIAWPLAGLLWWLSGPGRSTKALAIGCLAAMAVQAVLVRPLWPHGAPTASTLSLRVMTMNVNFGKADARVLADQIATARPDIVILLEVQQPLLTALDAAGALAPYPHRVGNAPAGFAQAGVESDEGSYVLSRTPLTDTERLATPNGQYAVSVATALGPVDLIAARPRNPILGMRGWLGDFRILTDAAGRRAAGSLIVAGDFNATLEHSALRRLLALGLTDAADASGAGWQPTYPANRAPGPLIAIDHVLVSRRLTVASVRTLSVPGTDHLGLVADVTAST